jgi:hypothetical protein
MTVTGALSSFRELGEMSPHKRQWLLSCDETPLPRENVMPCRLLVTYRISVTALAIMHSPNPSISDGRQAAVDGQLHPVHEARIV